MVVSSVSFFWFFRFCLFFFGAILGSFLNVIAVRYDPDRFLFGSHALGGRSRCPSCKRQLVWFELIPLFSFLFLRGRCRTCNFRLSKQYFFVELLSGFLVAGVVSVVFNPLWSLSFSFLISCLWIFVFELLLLMTLIDIRLQIIPNEVVVLLVVLGVVLGFFLRFQFGLFGNSLFGPYAGIFGGQDSLIFNRTIGALSGFLLFLFLFFVTRGRGMGLGDVKLVFALGIVFGWPDVLLISTIAFIIGACFGLVQIFRGVYRMKSFLPFGPFLAIASFVSFFWGEFLIRTYFSFFGIL